MPTVSEAKTKSVATPTNVRARNSAYKRLRVKWKKVKKADGYQVYEYKASQKKYVKVADVGAKVTSWKSKSTKKEHTYKVRAYRKTGKKRVYSKFSYAVSALPYKKNAKKVNAGKIELTEMYYNLSTHQHVKAKVKLSKSSYAKNKKAKVYDKTIRWSSSDESIAKVDSEGNITTQGKEGRCKIYARAHNGNVDCLMVYATNYSTNVKFKYVGAMVDDMQNILDNYQTDVEKITEYFEIYNAEHPNENHSAVFMLSEDREQVVGNDDFGNIISYKPVESNLLRVMQSFPANMEIVVTNDVVRFILRGSGSEFAQLTYLLSEYEEEIPESDNLFETANRWIYVYFQHGV